MNDQFDDHMHVGLAALWLLILFGAPLVDWLFS
jgi:hypothetical protein